ncbi:uncharacterized protein JCM15063_004229 [Sporobolomyces koalae]|uniref:uncharacterized protein n=1 Tax=Sporobolomyces koalae TaxID=500713 RepID=UPI003178C6CD
MSEHPTHFQQAVFADRGEPLKLAKTKWIGPKAGEVAIKVAACGINSTDYVSQYNLIADSQQMFPVCPGQVVCGEICEVGKDVDDSFKVGMKIGGILRNGGLGEYALVESAQLVQIDEAVDPAEACLLVFNCSKLAVSYRNNVPDPKDLVCVHGEGGYARLAIEIFQKMFKHENICLCTLDSKSAPSDYGLDKDQFLTIGKHLSKSLRSLGEARTVVCVDAPENHIQDIFAGCKDDARIVLLTPSEKPLHVPTGELVQRGISINGSPFASRQVIEDTIKASFEIKLNFQVERFAFSEKGVRAAWNQMEKERRWAAPVVVFE